jgi:hypothetical protein
VSKNGKRQLLMRNGVFKESRAGAARARKILLGPTHAQLHYLRHGCGSMSDHGPGSARGGEAEEVMTSDEDSEFYTEQEFDLTDVAPPPGPSDERYGPDIQRMWLSAQALNWRSLALVPASRDVGVIRLAYAFAHLGLWNCGESIGVADLRDLPFPNLRGPVEVINWHIRRGKRVILALRPCSNSVATVPMARSADCAILCVALGTTRIAEANETVAQVGRDHFVGTLVVRSSSSDSNGAATSATRRLRG